MPDSGVEVGTAYVTVLPSTRGFHKTLAAETAVAGGQAGTTAGTAFAGGFGKAAPLIGGAIAGYFAASKIKQYVGEAITAGSDLAESQSKVNVVFGLSAAAITEWSKTSATALLMSRQQALEAAGTYGNLFQSFGVGQQKATEMSTTLVQLAADLGSFNNTSTADALEALRSGLSGETEPLKRYGVALTEARLKEEALRAGIWNGVGILDSAQKAQAAYALIMRDTVLAQGDAERTGAGYANTMRSLEAAAENAKASIGTGLLVAIQSVNRAMGGSEGMGGAIEDAGRVLGDMVAGIGVLIARLESLGPAQDEQVQSTERVKTGWEGFSNLITSHDFLVNPITQVGKTLEWLGAVENQAAQDTAGITAELERAAYMQDVYAGRIGSSAFETEAASVAAQKYDEYLLRMVDHQQSAASGVDTLREALARFNDQSNARLAGVGIRDQWRALDKMGERDQVKVRNPLWKPGSSASEFVMKSVQRAFDPDVTGGRFAGTESGDSAVRAFTALGQRYLDKAMQLSEAGKNIAAQNLINRGQARIAAQFADYGIDRPRSYAESFLPDQRWLAAAASRQRSARNDDYPDESQRMGTTIKIYGGINVTSSAALREVEAQAVRAGAMSRVPHGAVAP